MNEKELKPFRAGDRQQDQPEKPRALADDVAWRRFPFLEQLLEAENFDELLQSCEATCSRLDELVRTGSDEEKRRAQLALAAYGKALETLGQLTELKDKMAAES